MGGGGGGGGVSMYNNIIRVFIIIESSTGTII